jgi:hypothetical protein
MHVVENMEELPQQWEKFHAGLFVKREIKLGALIFVAVSLVPFSYKMLSNIFLAWLKPFMNKVTGTYQCGFKHNKKSTTDQVCFIFDAACIRE